MQLCQQKRTGNLNLKNISNKASLVKSKRVKRDRQTAIGLQAVDGLKTSAYLLDTAKEHIEGKISIDEAQKRIQSYYEQRTDRIEVENDTKEADIVSARVAKLLGEKAFQFSPAEWLTINRRLFEGVPTHAGQIRQYNITKLKLRT